VASRFTPDGALRMPNVPVELVGRGQIRAWRERREAFVEYFEQSAHPGTIRLEVRYLDITPLTGSPPRAE
jgi:hypothetical protein